MYLILPFTEQHEQGHISVALYIVTRAEIFDRRGVAVGNTFLKPEH